MSPFELPFFKPKKDLAQLEEENERLEAEDKNVGAELSIAEKRQKMKELKARGLTPKAFDWNWARIVAWLRSH